MLVRILRNDKKYELAFRKYKKADRRV